MVRYKFPERDAKLINDDISEAIISIAERLSRQDGAHTITVKKIISELHVTNRVFYNRFHNVDEVLEIVYANFVFKMQKSIVSDIDPEKDYFGFVMDLGEKVLMATYDIETEFSQYSFERDSVNNANRNWWTDRIKFIIKKGKSLNLINDIDEEKLACMVWCFLRGLNADSIGQQLSRDEVIQNFRFGFSCLIKGVRA